VAARCPRSREPVPSRSRWGWGADGAGQEYPRVEPGRGGPGALAAWAAAGFPYGGLGPFKCFGGPLKLLFAVAAGHPRRPPPPTIPGLPRAGMVVPGGRSESDPSPTRNGGSGGRGRLDCERCNRSLPAARAADSIPALCADYPSGPSARLSRTARLQGPELAVPSESDRAVRTADQSVPACVTWRRPRGAVLAQ
jgi:hypothetical protein